MLEKRFEVLNNEVELISRINQLKNMGYEERDMYIITQEEENVSMLKGHTDIMIKEEDHNIFQRFMSFLKGEDSITDAFKRMGLEEENIEYYHNEVRNGRILLLVDHEHEDRYILGEDGIFRRVEEVEEFFEENKESIKEIEDNE